MEDIGGKGGKATIGLNCWFYVTGNNNYQRMLGHNGFPAFLFQGAAESCPGG